MTTTKGIFWFSLSSAIALLNEAEKSGSAEREYFGYGKNPSSFRVKVERREDAIYTTINQKEPVKCATESLAFKLMIDKAEEI